MPFSPDPSLPAPRTALETARLFLIDDQAIVLAGLRSLLRGRTALEIVGSAGTIAGARSALRNLQPELLVIHHHLTPQNARRQIASLTRLCPDARVLLLHHFEAPLSVEQAFAAGVHGYVAKEARPAELYSAIEFLRRGRPFVSPSLLARGA